MNEPPLIGKQRAVLRDLARIADERARAEPALAKSYRAEMDAAERALHEGRDRHARRKARRAEALEQEVAQRRQAIEGRHVAALDEAVKAHGKARFDLSSRLDADRDAASAAMQEALWAAEAFVEGAKANAEQKLREESDTVAEQIEELTSLRQAGIDVLEEHELPLPEIPQPGRLARGLPDCIEEAQSLLDKLRDLSILRYLKGGRLFGLVFLAGLLLIYPLGWGLTHLVMTEPSQALIVGVGGAAAVLLSVAMGFGFQALVRRSARRQADALVIPLAQAALEGNLLSREILDRARATCKHTIDTTEHRYEQEKASAQTRHLQSLGDNAYQRSLGTTSIDHRLQLERDEADRRRADKLARLDEYHRAGREQIDERHTTRLRELEDEVRIRKDEVNARHAQQWQAYVKDWKRTLEAALATAGEVLDESDNLFPAWEDPFWLDWRPPSAPQAPAVYRFGGYRVPTQTVVETAPWTEPRPVPAPIELTLPALCPFAEPASLLYHARDGGRDQAIESIRAAMYRVLTCMSPGRVRFLIVDPVGLGQDFGAFMHLADHDEKLVASRIWTEAGHIEQRLADLTAHMENVIQKYLRNRYQTIGEYNLQAGEVAEPYRVLVVANFPTNFTPEAVRRLVSIAQSGPRCGISVIASIDGRQPLPKGFDLADLEKHAINLDWEKSRYRWRDEDFGRHPLTLVAPPGDELGNRLLHLVGEGARAAQRVEVPFEFIAPTADQWWSGNSRTGVRVPLGRAGATRRQLLELGRGTSQHALVAGKTGSGKSTLLHALIVNLSLTYSPDEVELYLVDFKKGVEFKIYTTHELPHARVVAIESEREFGLSVLQRLDAEITTRGERFRAVNVQDLNAYREAVPDARLPRVLLIVDEFQEFFVEDDRLAQEAARLLDRLVRQGRAFGIHVLLGSQTIGGAYSLARSTIDQMAVRIALQCSEADAHLILSDDNSAARLLSRPGEAIYNDANGRVEGNDPFQVVWLGDDQRERYLTQVRMLTTRRPTKPRPPMIVFEGNAAADASKNHLLRQLLEAPPVSEEPVATRGEQAWLGEAMAIDELTTATFRRQNGSNLLIVGQQTDAALGMLITGLVGLAAQAMPGEANGLSRFTIIDGHQADAPRTGVLAALPDVLPVPVRLAGTRELADALAKLNAELERRQASPDDEAPALYLVLHGAHRMRDLRRSEDDFGSYGRSEGPPTPDRQLAALLREGPALGIHLLAWCDTLTNVQRVFDRSAMRELSMRVAFQMSVADSGNLIDSPAAAKLGMHRALFCSEEEGRLEKFRPYGTPPVEWLDWVKTQFRRRAPAATPG